MQKFKSLTRGNPCTCEEHTLLSLSYPSFASPWLMLQLCQQQQEPCKQQAEHSYVYIFEGGERKHLQFFKSVPHLLFTIKTAQQDPCFTSGSPHEGITTPGSMRSLEKHIIFITTETSRETTNVMLKRETYRPLQSTSEAQEPMF